MRKICGFRLAPRPKEVARRAKKASLDLSALGLGSDDALTERLKPLIDRARPAVLFDSFPYDPAGGTSFAPVPGLAYSLAVVTLGPEFDAAAEEELRKAPGLAPLVDIAARTAIDDAVRFVLSLLEEEARQERCELSPIHFLTEAAALGAVLSRLAGPKIGVSLRDGVLSPVRTAVFSASWLVRAKAAKRPA